MGKYDKLIGKKINLEVDGIVINSYRITDMMPTLEIMEGRGRMYKCSVDFDIKNVDGAYPTLNFDTATLNDLSETNIAICPFFSSMSYRCVD